MSGSRCQLSDAQLDLVATYREQGKSYAWIAQRFGISAGAIRWQCLRMGADHPQGHLQPPSKQPMLTLRGGRPVRRFSATDDELIVQRKLAGATNAEIGRLLNRKPHSILGRLMTIGMNADAERRT